MSKKITLLVNGHEYDCDSPNEAFAISLETVLPHLKFMSDDNIKIWVKGIFDMLYDKIEGLGCRLHKASIKNMEDLNDEEMVGINLTTYVYNLLLKKEGY